MSEPYITTELVKTRHWSDFYNVNRFE